MLPSLEKTQAAIAAYDAADEKYTADEIQGKHDALKALENLEQLGEAVGTAFGEETQDRNDSEDCRRLIRPGHAVPPPGAELSFVRRMVKDWEENNNEN